MNLRELSKHKAFKGLLQAGKWAILVTFLVLALRYIKWNDVRSIFQKISPASFFAYSTVILVSRLLYAFRWYLIGNFVIKEPHIRYPVYLQTNLLAEFVTIAMPTSIGGEVTRVLKLNEKGSRTALSTATILIDRLMGILSMVFVSVSALIFLGKKISFNLNSIIPDKWVLPLIIGVLVVCFAGILFAVKWIQNQKNSNQFERILRLIRENAGYMFLALFISILAHIIYSLAHYYLFKELHLLTPLEIIAVILTPQLARSIPISVLGISAGEGLMVASQQMAGVAPETAVIITLVTLATRYMFAMAGFVIEFIKDGTSFFKHKPAINE